MYLYQPTSSQAEEELSACDHFKRIFPTPTSHHYFQYFPQATKTLRSPTEINHHQSSNIKVSYYDKLLDACEHVAVKRGRAPLIREVFHHWSTLVFGSVLIRLRLEVLWSCSSPMAGALRRRRWGLRAKFWRTAFEKADIPVLEETKERAIRRIADFATLRKAPLVSKRASIRSICYLNICDKSLWVEKKREKEKLGRGRAGSQQKIANLPGPPESKMRIIHMYEM